MVVSKLLGSVGMILNFWIWLPLLLPPLKVGKKSIVYSCTFFKESVVMCPFMSQKTISMTFFTDCCDQNISPCTTSELQGHSRRTVGMSIQPILLPYLNTKSQTQQGWTLGLSGLKSDWTKQKNKSKATNTLKKKRYYTSSSIIFPFPSPHSFSFSLYSKFTRH